MPFTDSIKMVDVIIADKQTLNAAPSDVLSGKEFIGASHTVNVGSIPILPEKTDITLSGGESYNVDHGYNPLAYNVKAKKIEEQTPGTAISQDILINKTAWVNGEKITGTMDDNGKEVATLACGAVHTISRGFHNGSGTVTAMGLKEQTIATATTENVLTGTTCWVNGNLINGSMPNRGKVTATLSAGESYDIQKGYYMEDSKVTSKDLASQTVGTAKAAEIANNKVAWVNGEKVTGTMNSNPDQTIMLPLNGTYNIPNGYHTGFGKVTQNVPSKAGETVAPTKAEQTLETAGYYMQGNIVISGVDALNYKFDNDIVHDETDFPIFARFLDVSSSHDARINFYPDNWHNGSSTNIYNIEFMDLVESATGKYVDLYCVAYISKGASYTNTFGTISIKVGFDTTNECQYFYISGVDEGNITITSMLCAREYGV